jgi:hypothetical protein
MPRCGRPVLRQQVQNSPAMKYCKVTSYNQVMSELSQSYTAPSMRMTVIMTMTSIAIAVAVMV